MKSLCRRPLARLVVLQLVFLFTLACGGTTCDCVTPLDAPMAEEAKLYDSIQARLTPLAFRFIEDNLPAIIAMFMEEGLSFEVPPSDEEFCMIICFKIDICPNGCTLTAEIVDATLTPVSPNTLALDAHVNIDGMVYLRDDIDCDVPIHMHNKPVHADIRLLIDPQDHLMHFTLENLDISIEDDDYTLDCSGLLGWLVELLKGVITGVMNDQIQDQLDDALSGALDSAVCLACDFYTGGCPPGSTCGGDYCEQGGACRKNPLGIVGTIDMGELLADVSKSKAADLDIFVATGQAQDPTVDPMIRNGGVEIRMIGGAESVIHQCVPTPDPAEIPPKQPPPRLQFTDTVPGSGLVYMAGFGVSDAFLDWFIYKAYLSGFLCLNIGTETTDFLTSSTIGMMGLASLHDLTGGRNTPVKLKILPTQVPYMEVGAGTLIDDGQGNVTIDEPLLFIFLPGFSMDFYVLIDERWTRIMTVVLDITMGLGMDLDEDNMLVFLFGEESITMDNVVVSNYELLAEDPEALKDLLPTLVGMALPMLTDALAPIEIPPIEGFVLNIVSIQGDMPRAGTDYYEYMNIYANLDMAPIPPPGARNTRARIVELNVPDLELMSIHREGGIMHPEVILEVATDTDEPAEYSWRLDKGLWRPFSSSPRLVVHDPTLALMGKHTLQVRARTPGNYRSLDPTPAQLTFVLQPPVESLERAHLTARPKTRGPHQSVALQQKTLTDDAEPEAGGCACGTNAPGGLAMLFLLGLVFLRKRFK